MQVHDEDDEEENNYAQTSNPDVLVLANVS